MAQMYINKKWNSDLEDYVKTYYVIEPDDDLEWIKSDEENGPIFEIPDELAEKYNNDWRDLKHLEFKLDELEPNE